MKGLTIEEIRALPAVIDVTTTARALGVSRTLAYELLQRGESPIPVLTLGTAKRCRSADVLDWLTGDRVGA